MMEFSFGFSVPEFSKQSNQIIMTATSSCPETILKRPEGRFIYLDTSRLIKTYPDRNESYLIIEKEGKENHLLAYDHFANEMVLKDEVKAVLNSCYPTYGELMQETMSETMDFETVSFGVRLGLSIYYKFKDAIVHFRRLHTYAFFEKFGTDRKFPLGDPSVPRDHINLGFVFKSYDRNGKSMYSYDGYLFPQEVMEYLVDIHQIIDPKPFSTIYKKMLTDAYVINGKSL